MTDFVRTFGIPVAVALYAIGLSTVHFATGGWKPHRVETAWIIFGGVIVGGLAIRTWRGAPRVPDARRLSRRERIVCVSLTLLAVLVYSRAMTVGLLSDDFDLLVLSPTAGGWGQFFRPVSVWLFWLVNQTAPGVAGGVLHTLNLVLHVGNAWLVFLICRRLRFGPSVAVLATALFLLFPGVTEAVVWGAAVQDMLMATGTLAFLVLMLGTEPIGLALIVFGLALLSKESAVAVPFIAAALLTARGESIEKSRVLGLLVAGGAAVGFSVWRLSVATGYFATEPSRYGLKHIVSMTFGTLTVPWTGAEVQSWPLLPIAMSLLAAAIGVGALSASKRMRLAPHILALLVWIMFAVAPAYAWFFIGENLEGGRHLYLASAAWCALLSVVAVNATPPLATILRVSLIVVAAVWAISAYRHIDPWIEAARERDRILASAEALRPRLCEAYSFEGVPDNTSGAYIFRNGLHAALTRHGIPPPKTTGTRCSYSWSGAEFVEQ